MAAPNFWREVNFLPARLFLRRGKRKKSQGAKSEETVSHFRPCDLRHHVINKYHRCPSLVDFSGKI